MTCGGCKHWGGPNDLDPDYRTCRAVPHDTGCYCHGSDDFRVDPENKSAGARAVVQDASGFFAALRCRADFGCVLFEPK